MNTSTRTSTGNWRTPAIVLICGGLALTIALGTRHSFGLFLLPMTMDLEWNRQTFAFAMALQNLVYGIAQPFTGMIADRFGAARVMVADAWPFVSNRPLNGWLTLPCRTKPVNELSAATSISNKPHLPGSNEFVGYTRPAKRPRC